MSPRIASSGGSLLPLLVLGLSLTLPTAARPEFRGSVAADRTLSTAEPPSEAEASAAKAVETAAGAAEAQLSAALRLLAVEPAAIPRPSSVGRADLDQVLAVYAERDFRPLWSDAAGWTGTGRSVVDRLARAEEDALAAVDYAVPVPLGDAMQKARADLAASLAAVAYAKDARGARIEPSRLSRNITPALEIPTAEAAMTALLGAASPGDVLRDFNPPHPGYKALREKLAEMREATGSLPAKAGEPRAAGPAAPPAAADVVANMERWRWMPRDLGARRIEVNIPEYKLRLFDGGRLLHEARVVVGKPKTQTPVFSETMEYVVVNPSWSVPQSILRKEILPRLETDPDYLARHGYQVIRNGDRISLRQPPGERNALGFIKFMFPNRHAVYIHDTPKRKLFAQDERAFSHGCVRVDKPFDLAEIVLAETGFDRERLKSLIGKGERTIHLATPLPVHIGYFTVTVDETGRLKRLPDIYGHDEKVRTALRQGPSRVASR